MKIAVCEDEVKQQAHLQDLIAQWKEQMHVAVEVDFFTSGEYFLASWDSGTGYDIVFLDIHLSGLDGVKVAHKIRQRDEQLTIVFLTSRMEYVLKGYEVNAWRYLIKPIHPSEFFLCLNKAKEMADRQQQAMIIHNDNRYYKVAYDTITYIESIGHYVEIHTSHRTYQMRAGISQLEEKLPYHFFRCHRSYIINLMFVTEVGDTEVLLSGNRIPLSAKKRMLLLNCLMKQDNKL